MTNTLEQQEITVFYDQKAEAAYLQWLSQLDNKINKLSKGYNLFAERVSLQPFDHEILERLTKGNPESYAESIIDEAVNKHDVPMQGHYREYFWQAWNEIKKSVNEVIDHLSRPALSASNIIPLKLCSITTLPEIKNGELQINEEFLQTVRPHFETKVSAGNIAYELLNQIKETYQKLFPMLLEKKLISAPASFGRGEGLQNLVEIERFLKKRADGSVTINDDTLKQLL